MTKTLNVSELQDVLAQARQRQAEIATQIEALTTESGQLEAALSGSATFRPTKATKSGKRGPRASRGAQKAAIIALFDKNGGTLTTKQAKAGTSGFNTDASVVLMRLAQDGLIRSKERGTWSRTAKKVA